MNNNINISKFAKKVNNNEKVYSSLNNKEETIIKEVDGKNINQKINTIFNSKNYIYKANVVIKTKNEILSKTIIGRNNNYLITKDNELISINDVLDIYYQ